MTGNTGRSINGAAVRALRVALGIKASDLAVRIDVAPSTISRIEAGERTAAVDTQRRIADALGVTIEAVTYPTRDVAA